MKIPTYILNLKFRIDRKKHIKKEFSDRDEFSIFFTNACEHEIGSIGLWNSLKKVVQNALENDFEYFLFCEDDHQFTKNYSIEVLSRCIKEAIKKDADILCGGISWFEDAFSISNDLFWMRKFSGLQFTIIFKKMYSKILNTGFERPDSADYKISELSSNKYFIYPIISTQKEFGYSDVTTSNNGTDRVEELFATTENNARIIRNIEHFYKSIGNNSLTDNAPIDFQTSTIPTYVINLAERTERKKHIVDQFHDKKEFDLNIVDACKHPIGAVGLWRSIRKIIQLAIDNDDDVIIICEDDHEFTSDYSKEFLLKNIIEAHEQGCEYLNCGTGKFDFAIPISPNRFWVNHCLSTQFIVLYRKLFKKVLEEPYDKTITSDQKLSEITDNKMILHPFTSMQYDFGYSDVTSIHNQEKDLVKNMFSLSKRRLKIISEKVDKHNLFK